jgi:hypothetical protein
MRDRNSIVLSVGVGKWYPQGIARLDRSLDLQWWDGHVMAHWRKLASSQNDLPPGSPSHEAVPYSFKAWALVWARAAGYESALWMDSSAWAVQPINPIFDRIDRDGYIFWRDGNSLGRWCSDAALAKMKINETLKESRERAFEIPLPYLCSFGLKLTEGPGAEFLDRFIAAACDGVSFIGDWKNDEGQVSKDNRVKGHRHDQSAAAGIVHHMSLKLTDFPDLFSLPRLPPSVQGCRVAKSAMITAAGMRGDETPDEIEAHLHPVLD